MWSSDLYNRTFNDILEIEVPVHWRMPEEKLWSRNIVHHTYHSRGPWAEVHDLRPQISTFLISFILKYQWMPNTYLCCTEITWKYVSGKFIFVCACSKIEITKNLSFKWPFGDQWVLHVCSIRCKHVSFVISEDTESELVIFWKIFKILLIDCCFRY